MNGGLICESASVVLTHRPTTPEKFLPLPLNTTIFFSDHCGSLYNLNIGKKERRREEMKKGLRAAKMNGKTEFLKRFVRPFGS